MQHYLLSVSIVCASEVAGDGPDDEFVNASEVHWSCEPVSTLPYLCVQVDTIPSSEANCNSRISQIACSECEACDISIAGSIMIWNAIQGVIVLGNRGPVLAQDSIAIHVPTCKIYCIKARMKTVVKHVLCES